MTAKACCCSTAASLYGRGDVLRYDLPSDSNPRRISRTATGTRFANGSRAATCRSTTNSAPATARTIRKSHAPSAATPTRSCASIQRGEVIVSVATPVQRFHAVRGVLLLSTQGADIEQMVEAERIAIFKVFLIAARRHDGAVDAARANHRRPGPPSRRRRQAGAATRARRVSKFRISPRGATRSATCRARCAR